MTPADEQPWLQTVGNFKRIMSDASCLLGETATPCFCIV